MSDTSPHRTPAPTVWPTLNYRDAPAAIEHLTSVYGFVSTLVVPGDGEGVVAHAELIWPEGGGVMLGTADRPDNVFSELPTSAGSAYVVTRRPDELYERAVAAGCEIVRELRDEDYGSRGFSARDPEGNIWSFGTYPGQGPAT